MRGGARGAEAWSRPRVIGPTGQHSLCREYRIYNMDLPSIKGCIKHLRPTICLIAMTGRDIMKRLLK